MLIFLNDDTMVKGTYDLLNDLLKVPTITEEDNCAIDQAKSLHLNSRMDVQKRLIQRSSMGVASVGLSMVHGWYV